MDKFKPTKLYIVWHRVTGLFYFGKTTRLNAKSYCGSGKYWRDHIKKHGKEHVELVWSKVFTDPEFLTRFALFMSEANDIVNSPNWANLKPETGTDGGYGHKHSPEVVERIRKALTGKKRPPEVCAKTGAVHKGKTISMEQRQRHSALMKGKPKSLEQRAKMSEARRRYWERRRNEKSERQGTSNQATGIGVSG